MLLEFGFKNFLSFKEGTSISFKLDSKTPEAVRSGRDFATVMCVKGANGSGKTHLLKALAFIGSFASSSFSENPDAEIAIDPFFSSKKTTEFYVEFRTDEAQYLYELSVTRKKVVREALYETVKRKTLLFERLGDEVHPVKRLHYLSSIKIRSNASVISISNQHGGDALKGVHQFFSRIRFNVTQSGFSTRGRIFDSNTVSRFFVDQPVYLRQAVQFLQECDVGISDITISVEEAVDKEKRYFPVFHHKVGNKTEMVTPSTESSGTLYLYRLMLAYFLTIAEGSVLVLDEFDIYLHPHILPKILRLFLDEEINGHGAQFLFSAHNSEILDICGKYRTYLVNKENNASYAYRLDEIPGEMLRNDRSIIPVYNEGRVGGVPRL
ncbi:ATP/GTP-binding protein [Herbaspirillum sp. CAH-3]|nr:ATP-binding protein [Herbaspirillum sp. CAH-3]MRT28100.1 ATP-binding protein [Herbaspirillum sp. CAH-3]